MSSELIYGVHALNATLDHNPQDILTVWVQERYQQNARLRQLVERLARQGIEVQTAQRHRLDQMVAGARHQGVVAKARLAGGRDENFLVDLLEGLDHPPLLLVLDGIQDPHNLGACLRTADAVGADAVIAPRDNAAGLTATARKVAAGAAEYLPFVQVTNLARTLAWLKERGVWLSGTAADASHTLYEGDYRGPTGLVIGSEGKGMRRLTREACDELIAIPMAGRVESLNASVAAAVCLFEAHRQRLAR